MRTRVVKALIIRICRGTLFDKGRVSELLIFPLSFLVIWGLLFRAEILPEETSRSLLIVNLIWTISSVFQAQMNLPLMFDLWAREFSEICREGVSWKEFSFSYAVFGTMLGCLNLLLFCLSIIFFFGGGSEELTLLLKPLPIYYVTSLGLGLLFAGAVLRYGRTYAFLAWTGLQFVVMCSSPYSPLSSLPWGIKIVTYLSPFTFLFEYVRTEDPSCLLISALEGICLFLVGAFYCKEGFSYSRKKGGLAII